jgi:hypothetical protein
MTSRGLTSLSHGSNRAVADVKDTVLLEYWAEHGLYNYGWGRVGDKGRFFVELASEEINTKVAVLAGGSGCGDLDDLAWTTLKDQDITNANVVSRNACVHLVPASEVQW